jgi:hypothetical protein
MRSNDIKSGNSLIIVYFSDSPSTVSEWVLSGFYEFESVHS